ncbi:MAG: hypothetical protein IPP55_16575 [Anaerolineales bacterium]|nr:hypothetical protein [Anaerolineales bacterium]
MQTHGQTIAKKWKKTGGKVFQHLNAQTKSENGEVLTTAHLDAIARSMQNLVRLGIRRLGRRRAEIPSGDGGFLLLPQPASTRRYEHAKHKHYLYAMARGGMYDVVSGGLLTLQLRQSIAGAAF